MPGGTRRLLELAAWLVQKGEATADEIYEAFADDYPGNGAAREKKLTRDKADLRKLGVPLQFVEAAGAKGQYVVDPTSATLPKIELAADEAAVLWSAAQAALRSPEHPLRDDLEVALRKLAVGTTGLPPRAADPFAFDASAPEPRRLREWLETIADAVERRKRLRLLYEKPGAAPEERFVQPYGYAWRRGSWILVGHCAQRGAVRVFLLDRVRELETSPERNRDPDYEIPRDFDLRDWSRQEQWDYLVHEPREAAVRFRGSLARIAGQLLPGAKLATEPDDARTARLRVRNLDGLVAQMLAWGPEAELLEPEDGRALAREILAGLRARLADGGAA